MSPAHPLSPTLSLTIPDEAAMERLAEDVAAILGPGDVIALSGDLGAGKSTFSRALLRAFAGDPALEVPSPTFTLVQTYDLNRLTISHLDLYRLEEPEELEELGLEDLTATGAALIEWPEKAGRFLPASRLILSIAHSGENDARAVTFSYASPAAEGRWVQRLARTQRIRALAEEAGFTGAERRYLTGDASARAYEVIRTPQKSAVLMNSPAAYDLAKPGEIPSYSETVHRARTVDAFIALTGELRRRGYSAPELYAIDRDAGLLLQENLGGEGIITPDRQPIAERYAAAAQLLADMHSDTDWPQDLPVTGMDGTVLARHIIPAYSENALLTEADLFLEWYVPWRAGADPATLPAAPDTQERAEYRALWQTAFARIRDAQTGWVMRDYHSPNILWLDGREGHAKLGLIDYQDCVIGPVAYDLASLLLDARVDIPRALEEELLTGYLARRKAQDAGFDEELFRAAYAVMGAQRIAKILGAFVRLKYAYGKPQYMAHMPRMTDYLDRTLAHPALEELANWFRARIS
ncbi:MULTISPECIES: tRNA (adenosine(37)-N6)-threonylcarbamoyltransferase complex ATPase subunit type 1 TsaE [unclassified Pannonibacter]|uniref:tRNA (adenosine(37)-N6)-threonylcarbamoyltransferase complex ATPase subunit type 1 TsaE n=1 Tax=unclassified Pannonibacter TaxID=2627228 RepID=UPI001646D03B|nr:MULTISPECIES: tRNA (adenosine(37)-N6)-threonylcarbamoyltransferase complex ATPase subunit type 1 TsaE [unclassified Pannonibacter]